MSKWLTMELRLEVDDATNALNSLFLIRLVRLVVAGKSLHAAGFDEHTTGIANVGLSV
jgi:hypothetical protein